MWRGNTKQQQLDEFAQERQREQRDRTQRHQQPVAQVKKEEAEAVGNCRARQRDDGMEHGRKTGRK